MLSQSDIEFIKANRAEITSNRTVTIKVIHSVKDGADPYTGEATYVKVPEMVDVTWKEISTIANSDRDVINGVEIRVDDVQVSFNASVDLTDVTYIEKGGIRFTLITNDEKGLGTVNRRECIVRRST